MISELFGLIITFIINISHCKEIGYTGQIAFITHLFVNQIFNRCTDIGIQREIPYPLIDIYHNISICITVCTVLVRVETIGSRKSSQGRCITLLSQTNIRIIYFNTARNVQPIRKFISQACIDHVTFLFCFTVHAFHNPVRVLQTQPLMPIRPELRIHPTALAITFEHTDLLKIIITRKQI